MSARFLRVYDAAWGVLGLGILTAAATLFGALALFAFSLSVIFVVHEPELPFAVAAGSSLGFALGMGWVLLRMMDEYPAWARYIAGVAIGTLIVAGLFAVWLSDHPLNILR